MILFNLIFLLCTTIRPKIKVLIDLFLLCAHNLSTKMYDLLSFILSFLILCMTIKPAEINVFINLFYLYTTIRPKIKVLTD